MRRTQKRNRMDSNIGGVPSSNLHISSSASVQHHQHQLHMLPTQQSASPCLMMREIERCLVCHFLDLPSIASLLCTAKFFSVVGANIVMWRTVLHWNQVRLSSAASVRSFCNTSGVICNSLTRLEISESLYEIFEHLVHLPHLEHLTFPLSFWLGHAIEYNSGTRRWIICVHA